MPRKNYSLFGMPEKILFCKKCIISNQKPNSIVEFKSKDTSDKKGIDIDDSGICSACRFSDIKKNIDWNEKELQLKELLGKHRKKSGYDVVVPGSGGR